MSTDRLLSLCKSSCNTNTILSNVTCSHDIAEKLLIQQEIIITHSLPAIYFASYGCIFNLDIMFNLVASSCTTFKICTCFVLVVYLLLLLFFTC